MREYLDSTKGTVQMALLPGYAPDLNPMKYLWVWLKRHTLAEFCLSSLGELKSNVCNMHSCQHRQSSITACWKQTAQG